MAEKTSCGSRFDANELGKLACWVPQETLEPQFLKLDNDFSDQKSGVHFFCLVIGYGGAQHGRELLLFP